MRNSMWASTSPCSSWVCRLTVFPRLPLTRMDSLPSRRTSLSGWEGSISTPPATVHSPLSLQASSPALRMVQSDPGEAAGSAPQARGRPTGRHPEDTCRAPFSDRPPGGARSLDGGFILPGLCHISERGVSSFPLQCRSWDRGVQPGQLRAGLWPATGRRWGAENGRGDADFEEAV